MRKSIFAAAILVLSVTGSLMAAQISGNYLEARTASVWVGACFANSEMGLTGNEAVLGWQVTNGSWEGTPLTGLAVVGVVRATDTLGLSDRSNPTSSLVIVDQKATPEQARALVSFVRSSAPELFSRVVRVERAPIEFSVAHSAASHGSHHGNAPAARLVAGSLARIVTRQIDEHDATCANAELYYQPLTRAKAEPAYAMTHEFRGSGLGGVWSSPNMPSAFVGTFAR